MGSREMGLQETVGKTPKQEMSLIYTKARWERGRGVFERSFYGRKMVGLGVIWI